MQSDIYLKYYNLSIYLFYLRLLTKNSIYKFYLFYLRLLTKNSIYKFYHHILTNKIFIHIYYYALKILVYYHNKE